MNFLTKLKKAFMPKIAPTTVGTTALVAVGSAFAADGDLATGATTAISGGSSTLQTVGIAIIGVVAGVWVIKRVIALIR
ncbi:major capsid protein [Acinetobacter bereziniae]|uniref:major capsid protein n=1 Tax=Acinetobacter bereziniae TaxID=106648 RepID=UPI0039C17508